MVVLGSEGETPGEYNRLILNVYPVYHEDLYRVVGCFVTQMEHLDITVSYMLLDSVLEFTYCMYFHLLIIC